MTISPYFLNLRTAYFAQHERGVCEQAVRDAVATLEGFALRDGPVREVFVRFGKDGATGRTYLDLGDALWRAVEIDAQGWRVVSETPVRFVRPSGLRPLPEPSRRPPGAKPASDEAAWRRFVHVDEKDRPIVMAWLVAALLVQGPYVTLVLLGEQGSGKSTTARVLRILIDPVKAPLRSPPREERDIVIAAGNGGLVAFDNISQLSDTLADAMCRLSTGAGFGTRALYTDDEEFLFEGRRPQLLNGISNFITRDDLGDRSAVIKIPILKTREAEAEFWAAFDAAVPRPSGGSPRPDVGDAGAAPRGEGAPCRRRDPPHGRLRAGWRRGEPGRRQYRARVPRPLPGAAKRPGRGGPNGRRRLRGDPRLPQAGGNVEGHSNRAARRAGE